MNRDVSIAHALIAEPKGRVRPTRSFAFWTLVALAITFLLVVLTLDSSLTAEQRSAVYFQSGVFP